MNVFIFDVETTGLFNKAERDLNKQPYIIQFSGILIDMLDDGIYKEIDRIDVLIKPPIPIPYQVSLIHGIYDIDVMNKIPIENHINKIMSFINNSIIIGHNIEFDTTMILYELERLRSKGILIDFCPNKNICTMTESINFCKLPKLKGVGYKRPRLQELCKKTLGTYFNGGHNAIIDVEYTLKALSVLVNKGVIKLSSNKELTLF